MKTGKYKLKEVCVRLVEGHSLYSDVPLSAPSAALEVMRRELSQYDREVLCVVNLNTRLQPINFNIVSVGELNASIAAIPNIMKAGILSNAGSFLLLHCHPSGDTTPSRDDIETTKRVIEAGRLMGIPCLDHIIIGGGSGRLFSIREQNLADFSSKTLSMTAEEILHAPCTNQVNKGETTTMTEEKMRGTAAKPSPQKHTKKLKSREAAR